ncbi:MinD/ParA family ATP-binding protein [Uliginosibacterium sp. H1]|uniref:MinD/ParA family ATP-binding protein n=1 Tax=Uliginosibacterium sp. H1 TaxID=3114757 RepID=UPI002E1837C6|nr:hypothetical protein [Uliginosibacterium sp. H1]
MRIASEDQAAGLRRLFNHRPPEVLGALACGHGATAWLARQLHARSAEGVRTLVLDESPAAGNLCEALGASTRFDLLQAAEGHVAGESCRVAIHPGLSVLSVARLSQHLADRVLRQRTQALLAEFQHDCDEWLIHARPHDVLGVSPLIAAAPRLLLVVDPNARAYTEAYAALKRCVACADSLSVGLALSAAPTPETQALTANLRSVAWRLLGIDVQTVTSLAGAMQLPPGSGEQEGFTQRLQRQTMTPQALASNRGRMMANSR